VFSTMHLKTRPRALWEPAYTVVAAVAVAWLVVVLSLDAAATMSPHAGHRSMHGVHGEVLNRPARHSVVGALFGWALMVSAMMLPSAYPAARHVAENSLSWRRHRAMANFVLVYLTVWVTFGAIVLLGLGAAPMSGQLVAAGALLVAAAWQFTGWKVAALADCHRSVPLPPQGWPAVVGVTRFGLLNAKACARSCWAMMLVMVTVPSGQVLWMAVLTAAICSEKMLRRPGCVRRRVGYVLGVAGLLLATGMLL